ncbi:MAG: hypothetical protein AAFX85_21140, partial [Pseudomonadota bacterium]
YLLQQHQQQQQLDRKPPPQPPTYSANATETVANTPHPPETSSTPDASDPSVYERLFNSSERSPYDFRTLLATTSRNQRPPQRSQVHFHDTAPSIEQQSNDDELRNAVLYLLQQHQHQQQLDRKPPPQPPTYSANATETVANTPHPPETSSTPDASDPSVYERLFNSSE